MHQAIERRHVRRFLLRFWLTGRASARGEAIFRLSTKRIPSRSCSYKGKL
jgi:hypothetical protein